MDITLTGKRGRSTITNTVNIDNLSDEENLQEVILEFFAFLDMMGAELPQELIDIIEEYDSAAGD